MQGRLQEVRVPPFVSARSEPVVLGISPDSGILGQGAFSNRLRLEQRRTERSRRPFILLMMEAAVDTEPNLWKRVQSLVGDSIRETDILGWYEQDIVLGVIFTEIGCESGKIREVLVDKLSTLLRTQLTEEQARRFTFSFCSFPDDWNKPGWGGRPSSALYPEAVRKGRPGAFVKRALDVLGSSAALLVSAPLFVGIAAAIKLTSPGPVLFRQQRIGRYGNPFMILKFRSMKTGNDPKVHEEYVKSLIAGTAQAASADGNGKATYKLVDDPRITPVGKWLRKTSMDELPQFLNVFLGEMSLVGPRPPIPYEVNAYDIWHRRRLLEVKPGITGLWQVTARSKSTFDEMVRLDLQYAKTWSLWLDLKLLLQTPRAVITGDGAR